MPLTTTKGKRDGDREAKRYMEEERADGRRESQRRDESDRDEAVGGGEGVSTLNMK